MRLPVISPNVHRSRSRKGNPDLAIEFHNPEGVLPSAGIPVYGNHCGPGFGDPNVPAVDAVDQVCKDHDNCYDDKGYSNCGCDRALIASMTAAAATPGLSAQARSTALAAISYFASAPCVCAKHVCFNQPVCNWHGCHIRKECSWVPYGGGVGGVGPC
jgi:hypothetical protein